MGVVQTRLDASAGACEGAPVRRAGVPIVLFALVVTVACGSGQDPSMDVPATSSPTSVGSSTTAGGAAADYEVELSGAAAVPGPGDEDGRGTARLTLVPERSEVCYEVVVDGIDPPTAAHIHEAPAGESGDVVLDISPSGSGAWNGCAAGDQVLLEQLATAPERFYVNVHNEAFPNGAVRGQFS
jgi:hypothetical protein